GRLYPVDVLYRPVLQEKALNDADTGPRRSSADEERDLIDSVVEGVAECARHGAGDVLVFLPGEREIRETAEALRKNHPAHAEVLPLFARLSQAEQERIFRPQGNARRII